MIVGLNEQVQLPLGLSVRVGEGLSEATAEGVPLGVRLTEKDGLEVGVREALQEWLRDSEAVAVVVSAGLPLRDRDTLHVSEVLPLAVPVQLRVPEGDALALRVRVMAGVGVWDQLGVAEGEGDGDLLLLTDPL